MRLCAGLGYSSSCGCSATDAEVHTLTESTIHIPTMIKSYSCINMYIFEGKIYQATNFWLQRNGKLPSPVKGLPICSSL